MSKFMRCVVAFLYFFVMRMRNWHLDTKIVFENIANSRFRSSSVGSLLYHYNSGGSKTGISDIFKNKFSAVSWRQFRIYMTKNKEAL